MSVIQIPNLPAAIALTGTEQLEIVQAGVSCRTTTQAVANLQATPCGAFESRVSQTLVGASTEKLVSMEVTDLSYGVSIASNPTGPANTRMVVTSSGIYNLQFSLQVQAAINNTQAFFWLKKNGTNVSYSNTEVDFPSKDHGYVAAWNFFVSLNASEYVELAWAGLDVGTFLKAGAAPAGCGPSIPSVIATMFLVR